MTNDEVNDGIQALISSTAEVLKGHKRAVVQREDELREEYYRRSSTDEVLLSGRAAVEEWHNRLVQVLTEVFVPGRLFCDTRGNIWVVDHVADIQATAREVKPHASRSKWNLEYFSMENDRIRLITANDIEDTKLRKVAERMTGKIRMKDWGIEE